jgi:hypothetical protein
MRRESTPKHWPEDEQKMKELILYISQKCADDTKFGATKLNKILYFSDFLAYASMAHPLRASNTRNSRMARLPGAWYLFASNSWKAASLAFRKCL